MKHYTERVENWHQLLQTVHIRICIQKLVRNENNEPIKTHFDLGGAFTHSSGKFFPEWGQAGHSTTHAPGCVAVIIPG